jgi:hypothetical protein
MGALREPRWSLSRHSNRSQRWRGPHLGILLHTSSQDPPIRDIPYWRVIVAGFAITRYGPEMPR